MEQSKEESAFSFATLKFLPERLDPIIARKRMEADALRSHVVARAQEVSQRYIESIRPSHPIVVKTVRLDVEQAIIRQTKCMSFKHQNRQSPFCVKSFSLDAHGLYVLKRDASLRYDRLIVRVEDVQAATSDGQGEAGVSAPSTIPVLLSTLPYLEVSQSNKLLSTVNHHFRLL
jgi:hypothetical protein